MSAGKRGCKQENVQRLVAEGEETNEKSLTADFLEATQKTKDTKLQLSRTERKQMPNHSTSSQNTFPQE